MSEFFVKASQDRRRAGARFIRGKNGPFTSKDFNAKQVAAIESDPVLAILPGEEGKKPKGKAKSGNSGNSTNARGGSKSTGGRKSSAAAQRADKAAQDEQAKQEAEKAETERVAKIVEAIKALEEGEEPEAEKLTATLEFEVTAEDIETAQTAIELESN